MRAVAALSLLLMALLRVMPAGAHALDPVYLELTALGGDQWRVIWRVPDISGRPMPLTAELPRGCEGKAQDPAFDGRGWTAVYLVACPNGIAGGKLEIAGLEQTDTDALVRWETMAGDVQTRRLTPSAPALVIVSDPGLITVLTSYTGLGVTHILEGADHLLFVLALLLLVPVPRRLLWTITAFTLAHSLTLACSVFGLVRLPSAPVEVVIALSIVLVAHELSKPPIDRDPLSERYPAIIAFGFGLVHGLGFAGALHEIGLPQGDVPLALFAFNIGVEAGQLIFVAAMLSLGALMHRLIPAIRQHRAALTRTASYGIGIPAAYWVIDRIAGF